MYDKHCALFHVTLRETLKSVGFSSISAEFGQPLMYEDLAVWSNPFRIQNLNKNGTLRGLFSFYWPML